MPPMSPARRRALQAVIAALAGGGVTAASLGVAVPGVAIASAGHTRTASEATTTTASPEAGGETTTPAATTPTTTSTAPTSTGTTPSAAATTETAAPPPTVTATTPAPAPTATAPTVTQRQRQRVTGGAKPGSAKTGAGSTENAKAKAKAKAEAEAINNNVALSPQLIAEQANALASSAASVQALGFYRIPLFLLPVYKAAATQYGVPWQILAAINEIETNYGTDLSVSSAGAVGWMQFMPATWLQYGVDALNAGYADPYNPVDAIFAAARYLRAAGAAVNLPAAILAYNHSQEYVSSVLLRAKLISTYPRGVIATLTGLVDGRLPVTGGHVAWTPLPVSLAAGAAATAGNASATGTARTSTAGSASAAGSTATPPAASAPGSAPAPSPAAAAAKAGGAALPMQFDELTTVARAHVVAVQNGRVVQIGASRKLGRYIVLRDVYGDVFTYAGLGRVAATYTLAKPTADRFTSPVVEVASHNDPAPARPASAGVQAPQTLAVPKVTHHAKPTAGHTTVPEETAEGAVAGKVRLFAHPGNPDARAAAKVNAAIRARVANATKPVPLRRGSVVGVGTVLGTVDVPSGAHAGHLRFAIRPAGDPATVDPGPVLANWAQLQSALHPQGARAEDALLGATASDVFLLSKAELQRTVLSDPGISIYACGRHDVAAGTIDKRVLALLAFLSRSGLKPTVTALHCGQSPVGPGGSTSPAYRGDAVEISAINGTPVAGHQGAGTVTDLAIRTLLTLPGEFQPSRILSLMRYPGAHSTISARAYANRIGIEFSPATAPVAVSPSTLSARAKHPAKVATVPLIGAASLSSDQWSQLVQRVGTLPVPSVPRKPSSAAIPDPKRRGQSR